MARTTVDMKLAITAGRDAGDFTQALVDMAANDAFDRIGAKNRGPFSYEIIVSCEADRD